MPRAAKDSSTMPQPVSGLARPASVYITVSMSGQTRKPHRSKSSAVLTMTERSPGESTAWSPAASFAPPTPPAKAHTLTVPLPSWCEFFDRLRRSSLVGRTFEHIAHDSHKAERVRDPSVERHSQDFAKRKAADVERFRAFGLLFAGNEPGGKKPH